MDTAEERPTRSRGRRERERTTIVWFRQDLRLEDHPALIAAVGRGGAVVPVYIWAPAEEGAWPPGAASRWWLHRSLASLDRDLRARGMRLILRQGPSLESLKGLIAATGADAVFWSRRYEPASVERDTMVKRELLASGIQAESFNAALLHEPWTVLNRAGRPFQVFTPFYKNCLSLGPTPPPARAPQRLVPPATWPESVSLDDLRLEPEIDWAAGLREAWIPGEEGAARALGRFLSSAMAGYPDGRDRLDDTGTSRLSPHLHFGEIGPRQIWAAVERAAAARTEPGMYKGAEGYLRQLAWREFAHHLLFHFPHTADRPLRPEFSRFPWRKSDKELATWQRGRTGFPIVDAGMRELWRTGWMHNRSRMITASFLVKDLLLSWLDGARWFWDTLVDADLANNTLGWQWTAGCGADAAPYFRIFNPMLQGRKFDPNGEYVRRNVPELRDVDSRWIHAPWEHSTGASAVDPRYPPPMVDHAVARERALAALAKVQGARTK